MSMHVLQITKYMHVPLRGGWGVRLFAICVVVSIEFSPLGTVELTTNWYQLHNGDYG